jgi:hypothetical protein
MNFTSIGIINTTIRLEDSCKLYKKSNLLPNREQTISTTNTSQLMLFKKIQIIDSENYNQ